MFKLKLDKKGQVLKFVVGLIITLFVFFYSFKGIAELAKVGISSSERGNFNELTKEIKNLAENGEDGSRVNLEFNLGSSIKDRIILNYWSNHEKVRRSTKSQYEDWYKPEKCKDKDCLCYFLNQELVDKGKIKSDGKTKKLFEIRGKDVSCFEIPEDYYLYFLDNKDWNNFEKSSGRFMVSLYKLGNIIFACKDKCTWPNVIENHPKKHLQNNIDELFQEIKQLSVNGTEGKKKNFKLNLGYNKAFVHYPKDPNRKPIDYGCSEKFEKKLLYAVETQETANIGFGQNTICAISTFKSESTGKKGIACGNEKPIIYLTPKKTSNDIFECYPLGNINLTTKNMPGLNSFDQKPFTIDITLEKNGNQISLCKGASC